jgi:hypothetical protein
MSTIFYTLALFFIVYECYIFINPEKIQVQNATAKIKLANFMYFIWCIVGLAGFQTKMFVILLILSGISGVFTVIAKGNPNVITCIRRIDAIASIVVLILIYAGYYYV